MRYLIIVLVSLASGLVTEVLFISINGGNPFDLSPFDRGHYVVGNYNWNSSFCDPWGIETFLT